MDLILWRHAEAEAGGPDDGRALTPTGHKQAEKMAAWLDRNLPDNCRILASPARRAQQTAAALGRKFKTLDELGTGASHASILTVSGWPDSREAVLIVGHQPTLGQVASFLLTGDVADWAVKKAAVWWFSSRAREEGQQTALRAVLSPDYL
jgi:phosphohistidine phosphatase